MKIFTRLAAVSLMALPFAGASAQEAAEPSFMWGNLLDGTTTAGDNVSAILTPSATEVYVLSTMGTTDAAPEVSYAGEPLFTGSPYSGTSYANNFCLLKTDNAGAKQWAVYTNSGDFSSNEGALAATADGGVIFTAKVRHTDGYTDRDITFVDAAGKETGLDWTCDSRWYQVVLGKVSSEGELQWVRTIEVSTDYSATAATKAITNAIYTYSAAVDNEGSIYAGFNCANTVSFEKADGTKVSFTPTNIADWNGDSQQSVGELVIAKFDSNGYFIDYLTTEGSASYGIVRDLRWTGGYLYFAGYLIGNADGSTLKLGSAELAPSAVMSPVLGRLTSDLSVDWAKCFPGEKVDGKNAFQNYNIAVSGDNLWLCGQYNLKISDPGTDKFVSATQGTLREGFLIRLNKDNGEWLAARDSRDDDWSNPSAAAKTGLTGYLKVIAPEGKSEVYVYGYVMNAAVGCFVRAYDIDTMEANFDHSWNLVTQGGVPAAQVCALQPESSRLYVTARGNKAFQAYGADELSAAPSSWANYIAGFTMPVDLFYSESTGVVAPEVAEADENAPVEYFDLQGRKVANPTPGFYIVRQGAKTSKVLVK